MRERAGKEGAWGGGGVIFERGASDFVSSLSSLCFSPPRISTPEFSTKHPSFSPLCQRPIIPGDLSKSDLEGKTVLVSVFERSRGRV